MTIPEPDGPSPATLSSPTEHRKGDEGNRYAATDIDTHRG